MHLDLLFGFFIQNIEIECDGHWKCDFQDFRNLRHIETVPRRPWGLWKPKGETWGKVHPQIL